jgi:hypothetical protein
MHAHSIEHWQHRHAFLGARHDRHARRTWLVVALTTVMMIAEIAGGSIFGSMALVADGWHMSTHLRSVQASWASWPDLRAQSFWFWWPCSSATSQFSVFLRPSRSALTKPLQLIPFQRNVLQRPFTAAACAAGRHPRARRRGVTTNKARAPGLPTRREAPSA